jgi:hypothetical protein
MSVTPSSEGGQEFRSAFALDAAVPEPSTAILGLIGGTALACLRFRKI